MRALLFRRIIVDGVNYYQLFKEEENFNKKSDFANFANRASSEYFYIEKDSNVEVPDESLLNIYCDDGNKLKVIDDFALYEKVSKAFNDKYHYFATDKKNNDIIDSIKHKIMFQDACINNLVNQIMINQKIVRSNLPKELKLSQKNNILFCGKVGSGKKTIIDCLEKELDIPYADINIGPDVKETLENIINELFDRAKNEDEASRGIVFIRDNYNSLSDLLGDNVYSYINFLTSQGVLDYHGKTIDFRTVTFVVLLDTYLSSTNDDIHDFQNIANCTCRISTRDLSISDKYLILFSPNGRLYYYEKFLNEYGKKLIVDSKSLIKIIGHCSRLDPNMNALNAIIDGIVKLYLINGISDVYINKDLVKNISPILDIQNESKGKNREVSDDYWFERQVDAILLEAKKYVIGQDKALKLIVRRLVNNLRWANKEGVERPKDYIKNILIRGNSGTGKTFIPEIVLKCLDVPYYVANATEYTEAGYVGKDVEDMLVNLYHAAGDDLEKAERGVLVIDEIDKRAAKENGSFRDVGGGGVQEALYKFAEGTIIKINIDNRINEIPLYFNTSRLTIIGIGAFEGIEKLAEKRTAPKTMGFGVDFDRQKPIITIEDYMEFGMRRQFMRRIKEVIDLNDITKEQLIRIMKESKSSALKTEQSALLDQGIELEYTDDFYEPLAEKAMELKQGVTGIEKALQIVLHSINIEDIRASEIKKIILSKEVINNPKEVTLIPREKQKVKKK